MASLAAEDDLGFAATVRNYPFVLLNPPVVGPVRVVVTATTLELNK